jgi:hypothetical protein
MSDIAFDWRDLIVLLLATAFLSTLCGLLLSLKDKVLKSRSCISKKSRRTSPEVPQSSRYLDESVLAPRNHDEGRSQPD